MARTESTHEIAHAPVKRGFKLSKRTMIIGGVLIGAVALYFLAKRNSSSSSEQLEPEGRMATSPSAPAIGAEGAGAAAPMPVAETGGTEMMPGVVMEPYPLAAPASAYTQLPEPAEQAPREPAEAATNTGGRGTRERAGNQSPKHPAKHGMSRKETHALKLGREAEARNRKHRKHERQVGAEVLKRRHEHAQAKKVHEAERRGARRARHHAHHHGHHHRPHAHHGHAHHAHHRAPARRRGRRG